MLSLLLVTIAMYSCKNTNTANKEYPDCYNARLKSLVITWGDYIPKTSEIIGYQVDAKAQVSKVTMKEGDKNRTVQSLYVADFTDYCTALKCLQDSLKLRQTLSEPGDTVNFIEYKDIANNSDIRVMWHPQKRTYGSKSFRLAFAKLNQLIKKDIPK